MRLLLRVILVVTFAAALILPELGSAVAADDVATDAPCTGASTAPECMFPAVPPQGPSCSQFQCVLSNPATLSLRPQLTGARLVTSMARASPAPVYPIDKPPKHPLA